MPTEMKGDRSYHEVLRQLGVKNPGEVRVQNPVVPVIEVDSMARWQPPPSGYNEYVANGNRGALAANYSGGFLLAGPMGCWIRGWRCTKDHHLWTAAPDFTLGAQAVIAPACYFGNASVANQQSDCWGWHDPVVQYPATSLFVQPSSSSGYQFHDLYLPPKQAFWWQANVVNNTMPFIIFWCEPSSPAQVG